MYRGKFAFQNRLGQLVVGRKFTIFALFYFVFEGKFQVQAPRRAYIRRGDLTEGFLHYDSGGLTFGGAYTWSSLFLEFYGISLSFLILSWNWNDKQIHLFPQFLQKPYPIPDQNGQSVYPFSGQNGAKTLPNGVAHTYIVYVRVYPPPLGTKIRNMNMSLISFKR